MLSKLENSVSNLNPDLADIELLQFLEAQDEHYRYNRWETYFPDTGKYARTHYQKHIEFMGAGLHHSQRAFIAANRIGKTKTGAYEVTCHLTGVYPSWWEGKRFYEPIEAWCAGITVQTTKGIQQKELLGDPQDIGSGMIPRHLIRTKKDGTLMTPKKPGSGGEAIETIYVKHVPTGGWSKLEFKAYDQGSDKFQGEKKQVIWLDEEPKDYKIYTECLMRLMGEDDSDAGIIICTFTPLFNMSEVVKSFLPDMRFPDDGVHPDKPDRFVTRASWEDVPHLSEKQKAAYLAEIPLYQRGARTQGLPGLGAGAIYPYDEGIVFVDPFAIPSWWPKGYGFDVGWNKTAAIWLTMNPDTREIFAYSEHYEGHAEPAVHASAIKARGDWMYGAIDPASRGKSQVDGKALLDLYREQGLDLVVADNSVEAGIYKVGQMMATGQLKIFNTLRNTLSEFRSYARDENGKIEKKNDHLMDALRYAIMTILEWMETQPNPDEDEYKPKQYIDRDEWTGY